MTLELIDKQDTFEIVRDEIVAILVTEIASQQALAITAGKPNPEEWKLRIFKERANPWEQFLNAPVADTSPLVNVWYDNSNFVEAKSNIIERQNAVATYNIDCYGYGVSKTDGGSGHIPGDRDAALAAQRALRLVRNILMAAEYTYLGTLRGIVWQRWVQAVTVFQPQQEAQNVQNIVGARIAFRVSFNEFSPQVVPEVLELLAATVKRAEDDEIVIEADYDYPLP